MVAFSQVGKDLFYDIIPLNKINQIIIKEFRNSGKEGFAMTFLCKSENKCVVEGKVIDGHRMLGEPLSENSLYLGLSFKDDNLPSRMKKAFTRLIELNGGKLINDVF